MDYHRISWTIMDYDLVDLVDLVDLDRQTDRLTDGHWYLLSRYRD